MVEPEKALSPVTRDLLKEGLELIVKHEGEFLVSYEFDSFEDMNAFILALSSKTKGRLKKLSLLLGGSESSPMDPS